MSDMEVEVYNNLSDIDQVSWDRVAETYPPFYNYGWFKGFEHEVSEEHVYLVAKNNGQIVGILPGHIVRDPATYVYHNPRDIIFSDEFIDHAICYLKTEKYGSLRTPIFKAIKKLRPLMNKAFFPAIVFTTPFGYIGDILVRSDDIGRHEIYARLVSSANDYARSHNIKCVVFPWVPTTNDKLTSFLTDHDFISSYGKPVFEMDVNWSSFDGYLYDHLNANRRKFIKKEIKRCDSAGVSVCECNNEFALRNIEVFSSLVHKHLLKHDHKDSYQDVLFKLKNLYVNIPEYTRTFYAHRDGNITGYLLAFCKNGIIYPKYIGFDSSTKEVTYIYFNVVYYNLIKSTVLSEDIYSIYYGYSSEDAKLKRGCDSYNSFCHYLFTNSLIHKLVRPLLSYYNVKRLGYFRSEYSELVLDKYKSFIKEWASD